MLLLHSLLSFLLFLSITQESLGLTYSQWSADILPPNALSEHFLHSTDYNKDGISELFLRTSLTKVEGFYGPRNQLEGSDYTEVVTMYEDFGCATVSGDFNGDSFTDLVIGACTASGYGVVAVYYGNSTGFPANYSQVVPHPDGTPGSNFGFCMAAGKINNDVFDDIVITDYQGNSTGKMWVFYGNSSGFLSAASFTYTGQSLNSQFGYECQIADLNGDNQTDIVIGSPSYSNGQAQEGSIVIFYNLNGDFTQRIDTIEPNVTNIHLGQTIAACDVNGDGYGDLIAGIPALNKVQVFYGSNQGIVLGYSVVQTLNGLTMPAYSSGFGHEIACLGFLNNDTMQEVLIGSYDNSYLFVGSSTGLVEPPEGYIPGLVLEFLGVGDISGDGFGDIVMVFNGTTNQTLSLLTQFQNISLPSVGGLPSPSATPSPSVTPTPSCTPSPSTTPSTTPTTSASATPTLTPSSSGSTNNQGSGGLTKAEAAAAGTASGSGCMIIVVAGVIWYRRRKKQDTSDSDSESMENMEDEDNMISSASQSTESK